MSQASSSVTPGKGELSRTQLLTYIKRQQAQIKQLQKDLEQKELEQKDLEQKESNETNDTVSKTQNVTDDTKDHSVPKAKHAELLQKFKSLIERHKSLQADYKQKCTECDTLQETTSASAENESSVNTESGTSSEIDLICAKLAETEQAAEVTNQKLISMQNELETSNQELTDTKYKLETSNQQLSSMQEELQSSKQKLTETQHELEASNQKLSETKHELEASSQQLSSLREELESSNQRLVSMGEELEASTQQLTSLREELHTPKQQLTSLREELETSNQEIISLREELESSKQQLASKQEELETSTQHLISIRKELDASNQLLTEKEDELQSVGNQLISTKNDFDDVATNLATVKQELSPAGKQLVASESMNNHIYDNQRQVSSYLAQLTQQIQTLRSFYLESRSEITSILNDAQLQTNDQHKNLLDVLKNFQHAQSFFNIPTSQSKHADSPLHDEKYDTSDQTVTLLRDEVDQLKTKLEHSENTVQSLQERLKTYKLCQSQTEKDDADSSGQVENLREQLQTAQSEIESLHARLHSMNTRKISATGETESDITTLDAQEEQHVQDQETQTKEDKPLYKDKLIGLTEESEGTIYSDKGVEVDQENDATSYKNKSKELREENGRLTQELLQLDAERSKWVTVLHENQSKSKAGIVAMLGNIDQFDQTIRERIVSIQSQLENCQSQYQSLCMTWKSQTQQKHQNTENTKQLQMYSRWSDHIIQSINVMDDVWKSFAEYPSTELTELPPSFLNESFHTNDWNDETIRFPTDMLDAFEQIKALHSYSVVVRQKLRAMYDKDDKTQKELESLRTKLHTMEISSTSSYQELETKLQEAYSIELTMRDEIKRLKKRCNTTEGVIKDLETQMSGKDEQLTQLLSVKEKKNEITTQNKELQQKIDKLRQLLKRQQIAMRNWKQKAESVYAPPDLYCVITSVRFPTLHSENPQHSVWYLILSTRNKSSIGQQTGDEDDDQTNTKRTKNTAWDTKIEWISHTSLMQWPIEICISASWRRWLKHNISRTTTVSSPEITSPNTKTQKKMLTLNPEMFESGVEELDHAMKYMFRDTNSMNQLKTILSTIMEESIVNNCISMLTSNTTEYLYTNQSLASLTTLLSIASNKSNLSDDKDDATKQNEHDEQSILHLDDVIWHLVRNISHVLLESCTQVSANQLQAKQDELKIANEQINSLQTQLHTIHTQFKRYKTRAHAAMKRAHTKRTPHTDSISNQLAIEEEDTTEQDTEQHTIENMQALQHQLVDAESQIQRLRTENHHLQQQMKEYTERIKMYEASAAESRSIIATLREHLSEQNTTNSNDESKALKDSLQSSKSILLQRETEITTLKTQISSLQSKLSTYQEESTKQRHTIESLEHKLNNTNMYDGSYTQDKIRTNNASKTSNATGNSANHKTHTINNTHDRTLLNEHENELEDGYLESLQERIREKERDIESLRRHNLTLQEALDEHKRNDERIRRFTTEPEEAGSDVSLTNIQFLKNSIVNYMLTNDASAHRRMLPAVAMLLQLTSEEKTKIEQTISAQESSTGVLGSVWSVWK